MTESQLSGSTAQIVTAYRDNGLSPEQIAEALDGEYDVIAIKAVLMQFCPEYRKLCETNKEAGFSPSDEQMAIMTISQLAQGADDETTRLRAAMFIRNDKKGRLDTVAAMKNLGGITVNQFQIMLQKANASLARTEEKRLVIDVPAEPKAA